MKMATEKIEINNSSRNVREEYKKFMLSINEQRKGEGLMIVGGTHFKKEREKMSSSNYTLSKILNECIDNVLIPNCNNVSFKCRLTPNGYLQSFTISDDYRYGFIDIKKEGTNNPFNFTHMREGHGNDLETSQFGTGFKAAAVSSCDLLNVYTQVEGKFYKVVCDFNKMANEEIAIFSFDPEIYEISQDEYKRNHPYNTGSTLIFEYVKKNVYNKTTLDKIYCEISDKLSECYTDIINNYDLNIYVNDRVVMPEKDYSEEPQCKPFNKHIKMIKYVDEEDDTNEEYIYEYDNNYFRFNKDTQNWNLIKTKKDLIMFGLETGKRIKSKNKEENINWIVDRSVAYSETENECIRFKGIFMMYHPDLNTESTSINESRYPKGRARIYRRGRCHGDWDNEKTNGSSNFTDIRIDYKSKKIGNELGITWNKEISDDQSNDLCLAIKGLNKKIRSELTGDTASEQNKNLFNIALKNKITVPEKRRPTLVKKVEPEFKHGGVNSQIKELKEKELPNLQKKEEQKLNVLECMSNIPKKNTPLIIEDNEIEEKIILKPQYVAAKIETNVPTIVVPRVDLKKPIILETDVEEKLETKVPTIVVPHVEAKLEAKVPTIVVPHVEAKLEAKVPTNVELVMEDVNNDKLDTKIETISAVVPENNVIKPHVTNISETVHTTITVLEGKRILNKLKNCDDVSNDDIDKIIVLYCDRCAKDQLSLALKYMTISKKLEFLDEMIFLKYRFCNDDKTEILGGSKLNTIFRNLEKK